MNCHVSENPIQKEVSDGEKCLYENLLYLYHTKLPRQKSSRHPKINPTLTQINPTLPQINLTLPQINPTLPQINPTTPQINPTTPQNKSYVTPLHPEYFTNSSRILHQFIQNTSPIHPEYFTDSSRILHQSSRIHHSVNSGQFWLILSVPVN